MLTSLKVLRNGLLAAGLTLVADAGTAELTIKGRGLNVRGIFPTAQCRAPFIAGGRGVMGNVGIVFDVPYPGGKFTLIDKVKRRRGPQVFVNRGGTMQALLTLDDGTVYVLARRAATATLSDDLRRISFEV